jgi:hypothetical protein
MCSVQKLTAIRTLELIQTLERIVAAHTPNNMQPALFVTVLLATLATVPAFVQVSFDMLVFERLHSSAQQHVIGCHTTQ